MSGTKISAEMICECGHSRYDHGGHDHLGGCAWQHDFGFDAGGVWRFTSCRRFVARSDSTSGPLPG